jgi:hypothetical protein
MNLQEFYDTTYQAELERVESKFDSLPNPVVKSICGGLMSIEAITIFSILFPNGILAALVGAALPISLLLGIAYLSADFFELPEAYQKLVDEYTSILQKNIGLDYETADS